MQPLSILALITLLTSSCGEELKYTSRSPSNSFDGVKASQTEEDFLDRRSQIDSTIKACRNGKDIYTLADESFINWGSLHSSSHPVTGQIELLGEIQTNRSSLHDIQGVLKASIESFTSYNDSRDEIIRSILFLNRQFSSIEFTIESVDIDSESAKLPQKGESLPANLTGSLSINGTKTNISIRSIITRTHDSLMVSNNLHEWKLDIMDKLGLTTEFQSLIREMGVDINPKVDLKFSIKFINMCQTLNVDP